MHQKLFKNTLYLQVIIKFSTTLKACYLHSMTHFLPTANYVKPYLIDCILIASNVTNFITLQEKELRILMKICELITNFTILSQKK